MKKTPIAKKATNGFALYDLDQTLAPWDMQLLFANWVFHKYPFRRVYLVFFLVAMPLAKLLGARRLKRLFLSILHGLSPKEVDELCCEFADYYCPKIFYPEILSLLEDHQEKEHLCILTSASPYLYVKYIGEKLKFDHTFGTMVGESDFFPLIPKIEDNNKSKVKTQRLSHWLNLNSIPNSFPLPNSTAYTDSRADLPLVEITEKAVLVNPSEKLQDAVANDLKKPYTVYTPSRPFSNDWEHFCSAVLKLFGLYPI